MTGHGPCSRELMAWGEWDTGTSRWSEGMVTPQQAPPWDSRAWEWGWRLCRDRIGQWAHSRACKNMREARARARRALVWAAAPVLVAAQGARGCAKETGSSNRRSRGSPGKHGAGVERTTWKVALEEQVVLRLSGVGPPRAERAQSPRLGKAWWFHWNLSVHAHTRACVPTHRPHTHGHAHAHLHRDRTPTCTHTNPHPDHTCMHIHTRHPHTHTHTTCTASTCPREYASPVLKTCRSLFSVTFVLLEKVWNFVKCGVGEESQKKDFESKPPCSAL